MSQLDFANRTIARLDDLVRELTNEKSQLCAIIDYQRAENEKLKALIRDKQYVQLLADYNKGHLSHYDWLRQRDGGIRELE